MVTPSPASSSFDDVSPSVIERSAESVVLIKADHGLIPVWGAGTVVHNGADRAYVFADLGLQSRSASGTMQRLDEVEVIVRPGSGAEHHLRGLVGEFDQQQGYLIVTVEGAMRPPALPWIDGPVTSETPLLAIGFPFMHLESSLDRTGAAPLAVPCRFEEWHTGPEGRRLGRLRGLAETGFLGGPVVSQSGSLVGIVSSVRNSEARIAFVGVRVLEHALGPRVDQPTVRPTRRRALGSIRRFKVHAILRDPRHMIVSAEARAFRDGGRRVLSAGPDGSWLPLEGPIASAEMTLSPSGETGGRAAHCDIETDLPAGDMAPLLFQVMFATTDGKISYSEPREAHSSSW
jgi:hypothetical protein